MAELLFIACARKNESRIREITDHLMQAGLKHWVYYRDIKAGRNWRIASREAVVECTHMLACLSPAALESINVRTELHLARCYAKPIIPIMIEDCYEQLASYAETKWLLDHRIIDGRVATANEIFDQIMQGLRPPTPAIPLHAKQIFMTYPKVDEEAATELTRTLEKLGGYVWLESERIVAGMHSFEQRNKAFMQANFLIICLSMDAIKDDQVKRDIQLAFSRNIPIIPIITKRGSTNSIQELSQAVAIDELCKDILDINWIRYTEDQASLLAHLQDAFDLFASQAHRKQGIFISYRRADTAAASGRLHDRVVSKFGSATVYRDVTNIPPGVDYTDYIASLIAQCAVMLVLIGDQWTSLKDATGNSRLYSPDDIVRMEIELALAHNDLTTIPILIGDATIPTDNDLPNSIHRLTKLNAFRVRHDPDFHSDVEKLIAHIATI